MARIQRSRFVADNLAFITLDKGICNGCIHVHDNGSSCDAFPKGIPEVILRGIHDDRKPFPNDNNIRFEPRVIQGA